MENNNSIKEIAEGFFRAHYPNASSAEIEKQVKDWENKIPASRELVKFFQSRVGQIEGKKVLDVGFGSGGVAIALAEAGGKVYGVDTESDLLSIAQNNLKQWGQNADLQIYEGKSLPFPDNYFDYVVCASVLEHVSFPEIILKEILRVVHPGGRFFLSLPNRLAFRETHTLAYFVSYLPRTWAEVYLRLLGRSSLAQDNLHFYSYFAIVRMLKKSGFNYKLISKNPKEMGLLKRYLMFVLDFFGLHYTAFLPQLMFVIEKIK